MARTNNLWKTGTGGTYIQTIGPSGYDVLINGTDKYLNFNTVVGTSGYGFRDNAGSIEFKNSGGVWAGIGSGGGGSVGPGTINEIAYFNTANSITSLAVATYPSLTELAYVKGVTSAIQTQLDGKQASLGFTPYNATNPSGYTSNLGNMVLASAQTNTGAKTFNTGTLISPDITGGTAVGSNIIYKSTTGVGTAAGIAHQFVGGTNGGTVAMTVLNDGKVGIGTTGPVKLLTVNGECLFGTDTNFGSGAAGAMRVASSHSSNYIQILADFTRVFGLTYDFNNITNNFQIYSDYFSGGIEPGLLFGTFSNKTNQLFLAPNGNVGIKTTTTDATLVVNGSVSTNGNTIYVGGIRGGTPSADSSFRITAGGVGMARFNATGMYVGAGGTDATAVLEIRAGTATASTAPLKFTSGTLNTTAEVGAVEFLTDAWYGTITTGAVRKQFAFTGLAGTKVYYVSDTSGGAVTRKITFTDGILTSEV